MSSEYEILKSEFEKLKAENERLETENSKLGGISKDLFDDVCCERDTALAKLAEVEAERERLEDLLGAVHDTTLEADTKSRIANNLDATPNGWRFRKSQLTREREAAKVMREALVDIAEKKTYAFKRGISWFRVAQVVAREALAKADEIRGNE